MKFLQEREMVSQKARSNWNPASAFPQNARSGVQEECEMENGPLTGLQLPRIDVHPFEERKPKLTRGCRVGVRSCVEHRNLQLLEELQCLSGLVVGCSVPVDESVLTPPPVLLVQLLDEISDEQQDDIRVRVRLTKAN